jgi:hypothetical protein
MPAGKVWNNDQKRLALQNKNINQLPDNTEQEHGYRKRIDKMHYPKIKTVGPVGIFFSEKVHTQI